MTTYVIGHKNPDTDAICSAIGYADFLRLTTRPDAVAAACGDANARTRMALERAGIPLPTILLDVRPRAGRIGRRDVVTALDSDSLVDVYERMRNRGLRAIPVLDGQGNVRGMCSLLNLLELLLPDSDDPIDNRNVESSLSRIAKVIHGSFQHAEEPEREETLTMMVGAMSADNFTKRMHQFPSANLVIVAGDRPTVQLPAIEYGVRGLVVTGGYALSSGLISLAREKGVTVLTSPLDTATTTLLIRGAKRITRAIDADYLSFSEDALLQDIRKQVQKSPQVLFPVVDDRQRLVAVFSKSDLVNPEPTRLILVDHNEIGQAVTGADEAEIVEVIDHHRLGGGLVSREPIRFHNEPVGSTCTMVARFYHSHGLTPAKPIAYCLAAGMISDTLKLTSPTTTDIDRAMLAWIAQAAEVDIDAFASDFFAAGSALEMYSPDKAVRLDCKDYEEGGWKFAVAQIEENGLDRFWNRKAEIEAALDKLVKKRGYHFVCLMVTDITRQNSLLMVAGHRDFVSAVDYPPREDRLFEMGNVVSRKKQLLPHIITLLSRIGEPDGSVPA
ncbi:MAG TPA: putative manganese-dependent inorganic diphosphatase [Kiritimatiellia bacterium]|nr:putative manganese-dependent inorganic diphosphatase [Kiritimatiellia bacterium]HMO97503.1 putative manganese-dependent inorganic diphosphatase [Kiritimatiellia bacterium]HMP96312.1 putative manganese-dependent inorganic diphosphatase [Kiritimatiellia bacterium]